MHQACTDSISAAAYAAVKQVERQEALRFLTFEFTFTHLGNFGKMHEGKEVGISRLCFRTAVAVVRQRKIKTRRKTWYVLNRAWLTNEHSSEKL